MNGHHNKPSFGVFPVPEAAQLSAVMEQIRIADAGGLDLVGVQDHPYQRRYVETMALLGHIAASTDNVTVFPDVACLPLRPPAVLAKTAATIDVISGGRFELGLGAGAFWDAIVAYGGERRSPGESLRALREAIVVIRMLWSEDRSARFDGEFYSVSGAKPGPTPAHDIGIWLGVYGPRALRLLGETADGWVPSIPNLPVDQLAEKHAIIDEAAAAAGRRPEAIRRIANVNGTITDSISEGFLRGPHDQWVDQLTELVVEHRMDGFVLWPQDADPVDQTGRFTEVAAAVRERLSGGR